MKTFNLDAREFIAQIAKEDIPITQIVMNLPVSAELFCDVFRSCFSVLSTNRCEIELLSPASSGSLLYV